MTTNQIFIENGVCKTREWYLDKKKKQRMKVITTDPVTTANYKKHLSRTSLCWSAEDDEGIPPSQGRAVNTKPLLDGDGITELSMTDGAKRAREWRRKRREQSEW